MVEGQEKEISKATHAAPVSGRDFNAYPHVNRLKLMAFLGDLIVKMGANISPFQSAMKRAQNVTSALKSSLTDMRTTAAVFSKLAASIKATNNQMDRLIGVSKGALAATQSLSAVELSQSRLRLQQLKMIQAQQQHNMKMQQMQAGGGGQGGSLIGAGLVGGIAGAATSFGMQTVSKGVGAITDMAVGAVQLAADAETARITFEVLLGDAAKGAKLFKDIEKFAARTSFDLGSASEAVKGLLAAGVGEGDVLSTMQLLGDLAMGDANKLGYLSKAYTDVMNKGKLQGQELRQFAENGVGLAKALADTMGITVTEVSKLSEEGKISFGDVQKALSGLTGEGGRFHGMMERINQTFTGQWNSLIEQIQTVGRQLGAMILPQLTSIVSETNLMLQAFMRIEDKAKFIGDLLDASLSVAFAGIQERWDALLGEMVVSAAKQGREIAKRLDPTYWIGERIAKAVVGPVPEQGQTKFQAAQANLAAVLDRLNTVAPAAFDAAPAAMVAADDGSKLKGLFGALVEKAGPIVNGLKSKIDDEIRGVKLDANWAKETAKNFLGGPKLKPKADKEESAVKMETRFAGAMQRGSAEAYSTIVNAMRGNKDPQVNAIDKSTKAIVAAVKGNKQPQPKIVGAFA